MAIMIPPSLPSNPKPTKGESLLYKIFQSHLPDEFWVWYEPFVNGKRPDFIILSPTLGLLVLEIKDWAIANILEANPQQFKIRLGNQDTDSPQNVSAPLEQARIYLNQLQNLFKKRRILINQSGKYQGKSCFPIGTGVAMTNITLEEAEKTGLIKCLPEHKVIFKDELLQLKKGMEADLLIERMRKMFQVQFSFPALTEDQISTIRGEIYPEIVIREEKASRASVPVGIDFDLLPSDTILKTLDAKQESQAKSIGDGHRIFFGVSGSGKTLLLISRAKYLMDQCPDNKILILCYNICLASVLRSILHGDPHNTQYQQIQVMHFHDWAKFVLGTWPNNFTGNQDQCLGERVLETLSSWTTSQKWDVILIDEAHTFQPIWFRCCVNALKDREQGNLMIVADGNQKLYKLPNFKWKDVEVKAQGRTISKKFDLDKNYRNTQEILSSALVVLDRISNLNEALDEDEITFPLVQPTKATRHGEKPTLYLTKSNEQQDKLIVSTIDDLIKSNISSRDIAILYRRNDKNRLKYLFDSLKKLNISYEWITKNQKSKQRFDPNNEGVKFIASLSCLGLEFKIILFIWLEQFDDCIGSRDGETLAIKEIYVGMTRSQQQLYVFIDRKSQLSSILENSTSFNIIRPD